MEGMEMEFCHSEDSKDEFKTSNYNGTRTTPEHEYNFVVRPDRARDYGGGRAPALLACFLYAASAKKANSDEEAYDTPLDELEAH
eukprot:2805545-Rhodomonas_salina.1